MLYSFTHSYHRYFAVLATSSITVAAAAEGVGPSGRIMFSASDTLLTMISDVVCARHRPVVVQLMIR